MSDMIRSLEALAQTAVAPGTPTAAAEENAGITQELADVLRSGDQQRLNALLGSSTNVCCMVYAPEPGDEECDDRNGEVGAIDANGQPHGHRMSAGFAA